MRTNYVKKWLAVLLFPLAALSANAYDAEIDGIYYNLNSDTKQAEVTYKDWSSSYSGDITIPATITYDGVMYDVTSIGSSTFNDCQGLTSIAIPSSVTSIKNYAFYECNSLTSIEIPSSVTTIGTGAFVATRGLTSITVAAANPKYDSRGGCNAIIETSSNTLIAGCKNTIIPSDVTSIGFQAFHYSSLTSIEIPSGLTRIEMYAFRYCPGLTTVVCHAPEPPALGDDAWETYANPAPTLYVPASSVDAYKAIWEWDSRFSQILPIGEDVETNIMVSIGSTGYATLFCAKSDLAIPEGVKAYTGIVNGEWVSLKEVTGKIPAGTAVILKGEEGTYRFAYTTGAEPVGENDLKGTVEDLTANGTQYVLADKDGTVGFYKAKVGTVIPAGKAYLEATGNGVKEFFFNNTTGIEGVQYSQIIQDNQIYDLSGRRVGKATKGVYIINGKKILK